MSGRGDVESLADAVLEPVERDLAPHEDSGLPHALLTTMAALRKLGINWVRRYHRLELSGDLVAPAEPVLFVANLGTVLPHESASEYAALVETATQESHTALGEPTPMRSNRKGR